MNSKRILTAGLTPAWQQILRFDALRIGEVNRAAEAHWCASGKVFNVAIALAHLGADCRLVSPIGHNVQAPVEAELRGLGVAARLVAGDEPTRVCTTLLDASSGAVTELVENARPLAANVLHSVSDAYAAEVGQAEVAVLTGSLPAGTPVTFYRDLVAQTPCRTVLDARGPELLAALDAKPFLVKPNREELFAATLGRSIGDDTALVAAMHELNERGAEWVVVTAGKQAVWAGSAEGVFRLNPLRVERVVNPIGCGDCLAAGLAWGLAAGREPLDSLAIGIAAAAQNAAQLLPGRLDAKLALDESRQVVIERV
ncbi:MAG TPA: PfkB family carbohydrate kinase [Pirellulales bacterium]|nr:PfkB family carbohydrate kinase [Pirellulales bacterium]